MSWLCINVQYDRKNNVEGALTDFDMAWSAAPQLRPYLWQRGLAQYYAGRYDEGAAQFRRWVVLVWHGVRAI
jgi:hypothetical protein